MEEHLEFAARRMHFNLRVHIAKMLDLKKAFLKRTSVVDQDDILFHFVAFLGFVKKSVNCKGKLKGQDQPCPRHRDVDQIHHTKSVESRGQSIYHHEQTKQGSGIPL